MRLSVLVLCAAILSICAGCRTTAPAVLSEVVSLLNTWDMPDLFCPDQEDAQEDKPIIIYPPNPFKKYFGLKRENYSYIYPGLKLLRYAILLKDDNYIFELQTDGDIELARKYYGNAMQFRILILGTGLQILTTASMEEAVLISGRGKLLLLVDKEDRLLSARWDSNYEVKARLKMEIDRDRMRIFLPVKVLPNPPAKGRSRFNWWVYSNLALPPVKPLATNLPDVLYVPEICRLTPPARSTYQPYIPWEVREPPEAGGGEGEE